MGTVYVFVWLMFSTSNYCFIVVGLYKWKSYLLLYYIVSTYLVYFGQQKLLLFYLLI